MKINGKKRKSKNELDIRCQDYTFENHGPQSQRNKLNYHNYYQTQTGNQEIVRKPRIDGVYNKPHTKTKRYHFRSVNTSFNLEDESNLDIELDATSKIIPLNSNINFEIAPKKIKRTNSCDTRKIGLELLNDFDNNILDRSIEAVEPNNNVVKVAVPKEDKVNEEKIKRMEEEIAKLKKENSIYKTKSLETKAKLNGMRKNFSQEKTIKISQNGLKKENSILREKIKKIEEELKKKDEIIARYKKKKGIFKISKGEKLSFLSKKIKKRVSFNLGKQSETTKINYQTLPSRSNNKVVRCFEFQICKKEVNESRDESEIKDDDDFYPVAINPPVKTEKEPKLQQETKQIITQNFQPFKEQRKSSFVEKMKNKYILNSDINTNTNTNANTTNNTNFNTYTNHNTSNNINLGKEEIQKKLTDKIETHEAVNQENPENQKKKVGVKENNKEITKKTKNEEDNEEIDFDNIPVRENKFDEYTDDFFKDFASNTSEVTEFSKDELKLPQKPKYSLKTQPTPKPPIQMRKKESSPPNKESKISMMHPPEKKLMTKEKSSLIMKVMNDDFFGLILQNASIKQPNRSGSVEKNKVDSKVSKYVKRK